MVKTTKAQRVALKKVFDRAPIFDTREDARKGKKVTYREFRKTVQETFFCDGAVVVHWAGMWLCIETDGYCHS